jgi:hypothetical protein
MYARVLSGDVPIKTLRVGRTWRVVTADLIAVLSPSADGEAARTA